MPGAALPTFCCQLMRGVTVAFSAGSGPGLWLPPVSHANEGVGIDDIHDVSGDSESVAHAAHSTTATSAAYRARSRRIIDAARIISPLPAPCLAPHRPPRRGAWLP